MKPKHTQVPMSTKVFFGLGMLAMQMFPAALGVFMVVLVQDFGFDPVMWGLIFFLPRVVDAITCLLYTSPSPRDKRQSRMPSSA